MTVDDIHNDGLLTRASEGDEKAFTIIFNHYYPLLRPFIRSFSGTETHTEEVLQETFIRVWLNRDKLPQIQNLRAWIYTISTRLCLKAIHRDLSDRQRRHELTMWVNQEDQATPFDWAHAAEIRRLITDVISRMPPQRRRIYELSRTEGLKPAAIAAQLSLSVSTVKNVLSASLGEIRKHLKAGGYLLTVAFSHSFHLF